MEKYLERFINAQTTSYDIALREITAVFQAIEGKSAFEILGSPDHLKMKSCMTLFNSVQEETNVFLKVLEKYYNGELCRRTIKQLTEI